MMTQTSVTNMENKETFRKRLEPCFSPSDQRDIHLAYILAKFGHRAQTRKELVDGKPMRYFEHPRRVAIILMDEVKLMNKNMIIGALLHDSLEDTEDVNAELLEHSFGTDVTSFVTVLSKVPKEGYHDRLNNCWDWEILVLKACDRLDNLRSLMIPGTSVEFQKKQLKETKEIYFPLFDRMVEIFPRKDKSGVIFLRDEIRRLVEKYSTIIEIKEEYRLLSKD